MVVQIYMTSVAPNREIHQQQNRIKLVLDGKRIPYEELDLSKDGQLKEHMRSMAGKPDLLPPQVFNGETYCGNFQEFDDALEDGRLKEFLHLA